MSNSLTSQYFRDAMAKLAAAASIIISNGNAGITGITVSSLTSVSDDPTSVLFCINKSSQAHDVIQANGKVTINILSGEQQALALHFASMLDSSLEERFNWDIWSKTEQGIPYLKDALVILNCDIVTEKTFGTHTVFFAEVKDININDNNALLYFNRTFHSL